MIEINWHKVRGPTIISLVVLVLFLLATDLAIAPILGSMDRALSDTDSVHHLLTLAAEKPEYQAALMKAQQFLASQDALYHDSSPELASAAVQNTLQSLVVRCGGQVLSSTIGPSNPAHDLEILTVSLSLTLPTTSLAKLLAEIDSQNPLLVVQSIDIRSTDNGNGTGPLDVQLQVNGFGSAQ